MTEGLRTVLTLNSDRSIRSGSTEALTDAIRRGADLRIGTAFRHNEHIDPSSSSNELIEEVAEFRQTLLLDDRWAAGIMTLRMPVELPEGFGPRPSMSFFLYNQDGTQAIARPYLDGQPPTGGPGPSAVEPDPAMPKYHQYDSFDAGTNAPSHNFVYDFDSYRFMVNDRWREVLAHDHTGRPTSGSVEALAEAFMRGAPVKVAIRKFCVGLVPPGESAPEHEAFIHAGSCYYYTDRKLFITGTHPAVRVKPAIPLRYGSGGWDFCWLVARTDGQVERWRCDPYTLAFDRSTHRYDMRWFVSGDDMVRLDRFLTVDDFKRAARHRVPRMFYEYADSGAYTESTYRANSEDFYKVRLEQRVGVDISTRSLATTMLGQEVTMPLGLAPTGAAGMQTADGEIKAARAAEAFGVPFTLSTVSICSIEDIASATSRPFWFQLYVRKDRDFDNRLIDRAREAKCAAIVVTMDCQHYGQRHKDVRNGLTVPIKYTPKFLAEIAIKPRWALAMLQTPRRTFGNFAGHVPGATSVAALAEWMGQQDDLTLNWKDLLWIKERFGGPLVVKGILHPDDAREAIAHGADAIVVSNHGGRQLDGAPSTIRVLPRIVDAVDGRCEIYLDSGVRSGHDMIKAVALGARAVFIGRPFLYGLGVAGEAGVRRVLEIIRAEADSALGLMGESDITTLGPHNIESNDLVKPHGL